MKLSEFEQPEDLMSKYNQLKDLPQDELTKRLFEEVARQKSEGTFNYSQLKTMLENIKGMLPNETYQNMQRILETLK